MLSLTNPRHIDNIAEIANHLRETLGLTKKVRARMPIELTPTKIDDKPQIHDDDLSPVPQIPKFYISTQNPMYNNAHEKSPEQHDLREHSNN